MTEIKTWQDRCEEHPDHQSGMVSHAMIKARMQEEIEELRERVHELGQSNAAKSGATRKPLGHKEHPLEVFRRRVRALEEEGYEEQFMRSFYVALEVMKEHYKDCSACNYTPDTHCCKEAK